jgi:hypothetical protein
MTMPNQMKMSPRSSGNQTNNRFLEGGRLQLSADDTKVQLARQPAGLSTFERSGRARPPTWFPIQLLSQQVLVCASAQGDAALFMPMANLAPH